MLNRIFGSQKSQVISAPSDRLLELPNTNQRVQYYTRSRLPISYDFIYKPPGFSHDAWDGGYGQAISTRDPNLFSHIASFESEDFLGLTIIGTGPARYLGKRLVNHFENYGAGHGYVFDVTRSVAMIPLTNAMGCGELGGSMVVISPETSFHEGLDTLAHEYLHNCGEDHEYDEQGNPINLPDHIYAYAGRLAGYLAQFPEAS